MKAMADDENGKKPGKSSVVSSRDARLAAALRENLRRRQAQERARGAEERARVAEERGQGAQAEGAEDSAAVKPASSDGNS